MNPTFRLLVVEDDDVDRQAVTRALRRSSISYELGGSGAAGDGAPRVVGESNVLAMAAQGLPHQALRYLVEMASNGSEALAVLERTPIDLVITDLRMPVMDGFELLAAMMHRFPGVPVIVLTSMGDPITQSRIASSGACAFLDKPIDSQQLTERIELHLARSAAGNVRGIALPSFLQLLSSERKSCCLRLRYSDREGLLFFEHGQLVHAEAGEEKGEELIYSLLAGDETPWIEIQAFRRPAEITIKRQLTHLLLEAARLADEDGRFEGEMEEDRAFEAFASQIAPPLDHPERLDPLAAELVQVALKRASHIQGLGSAAVVAVESGRVLGQVGRTESGFAERAGAAAEMMRLLESVQHRLNPSDDFDELMLSSRPQILLARRLPIEHSAFLILCFEGANPNLGLARLELREIHRELRTSNRAQLAA